MPKVLRVEDCTGGGPYIDSRIQNYMIDEAVRRNLPTPECDSLEIGSLPLYWTIDYVCGFLDADQMRQWFRPKVMAYLLMEGYTLSVYYVPDHALVPLGMQCLFHKDQSSLYDHGAHLSLYHLGRSWKPRTW